MTYKTCYWDEVEKVQKERDCTPDEVAEIEVRKVAPVEKPALNIMDVMGSLTPEETSKLVDHLVDVGIIQSSKAIGLKA